ncbi:MAG: UDP-N-acetylmuramate dehydrogenase [Anaerolineales bacterium]|nr:UDP-N-acetylmuramate dehydrogenase [Anaerolineales bacterium]
MALSLPNLRAAFGKRLQENVSLAAYTSARIGGDADALIIVNSADELAETISRLWELETPFFLLGGGSNILVSDAGFRGVIVLNKAKEIRFNAGENPSVWAESGVTMSRLAHQAATRGFSGLEWAATVPGTVGGAVYGNAGAFDGDMAGSLLRVEMLTKRGREAWSVSDMEYAYRSSTLKGVAINCVILSAEMMLKTGDPAQIQERMRSFIQKRKNTQPRGASLGSMFKNPEGDYAGRLIEAAGLKGTRIGNVEISTLHANFFVNHGKTKAADLKALIELTQKTVQEKFGVSLELEIELVGEWHE